MLTLVLGMHRSGTSAVAALLGASGADLGREDHLLGASAENERGYFENRRAVRLNDDLLVHFGGSWDRPPSPVPGWENSPGLERFRAAADAILTEDFPDDAKHLLLKDPRLSIVAPLWRTVRETQTLVVLRDPAEVAASLSVRGIPFDRCVRLWMRYTLDSFAGVDRPAVVFYSDLFEQPERVVDAVGAGLGLDVGPHLEVVAGELRHNRVGSIEIPETGAVALAPAAELYAALYEAAGSDGVDLASWGAPGALDDTGVELAAANARVARLEHDAAIGREAATEIERLQAEVGRAERLSATVTEALAAQRATAAELEDAKRDLLAAKRERDAAVRETALLNNERRSMQAHVSSLQRASTGLLRAESQLRAQVRATEQREQQLREKNRKVEKRHNVAKRQRDRFEKQVRTERERATRAERSYQRLSGRRSVRAVLGLAAVLRPFFRVWRALRRRLRRRPVDPPAKTARKAEGKKAKAKKKEPKRPQGQPVSIRPTSWVDTVDRLLHAPPAAVLIPVYGAPDDVRLCLDTVFATVDADVEVIVINDASPGTEIPELLATYEGRRKLTLLENGTNLGFTRTVNRGLEVAAGKDVVILNSDTQVTPGWLPRLRSAAYSAADIGTATPLSDNAGAFSAPEQGTNEYPDVPLDSIAREVTRRSEWIRPEGPTGNGYCMYMKRAFLDDVGLLDAESFPRGYGEENDLCMRGIEAGWRHVIDDATLVRHALGRSFGAERSELMKVGRAKLDELHPTYTARVREFLRSEELAAARGNVGVALENIVAAPGPRLPRIMFVMHGAGGGTPLTNMDLMRGVAERYEPLLLRSDSTRLTVHRLVDDELIELESMDLHQPIAAATERRDDYREFVAGAIARHGVELVHLRQFIHHTLDIGPVCEALGVPLIVSLHDFFTVCPTTQLLDEKLQFCGGKCTAGQGQCFVTFKWLEGLPHLKHDYVYAWRDLYRPVLANADAIVTTSSAAKDIIVDGFPELQRSDFRVIEHGRDLEQRQLAVPPVPGGKIRILIPGNVNEQKGGLVIKELMAMDEANRLEFVVLGNVRPALKPLGIEIGPYEREEFGDLVERIAPAFSGIMSIWAETYSHTLSESWAAGLPVLAFDVGAVGERIHQHGGGWLFELGDVEGMYREILRLADDAEAYRAGLEGATIANLRSTEQMAGSYLDLYRDVVAARRRTRVDV